MGQRWMMFVTNPATEVTVELPAFKGSDYYRTRKQEFIELGINIEEHKTWGVLATPETSWRDVYDRVMSKLEEFAHPENVELYSLGIHETAEMASKFESLGLTVSIKAA